MRGLGLCAKEIGDEFKKTCVIWIHLSVCHISELLCYLQLREPVNRELCVVIPVVIVYLGGLGFDISSTCLYYSFVLTTVSVHLRSCHIRFL